MVSFPTYDCKKIDSFTASTDYKNDVNMHEVKRIHTMKVSGPIVSGCYYLFS